MLQFIKNNPKIKMLVHWLMIPSGQARPRLWVSWFVNPFFHKKGKKAHICRRTRMDVLPFNRFELGDESTIEDFSTVNNGVGDVIIGNRSRVGLGNTIIGPVVIKDDVRLAQNIVLSGLNHVFEDITKPIHEQGVTTLPIVIENGAWIGANVTILPGVIIGKNSIVAAGSVVTKSVPEYSVAVGNPAKVLKKFNKETWQWERVNAASNLVMA